MGNTPAGRRRQQDRYRQAQDQLTQLQLANVRRPAAQRREPDKIVISPGGPKSALGCIICSLCIDPYVKAPT
jgi:hypothetical protein